MLKGTTMSNTNELHVIFGTGPLGKATMHELVRLGKRVRMVNRSGKAADLPDGVEVVQADAYDPTSTIQVSQGAAAVYQCAQPEYHEWVEKFPPMQAAIMQGAIANGAKFIVGDNLYSYGDPNGLPITEAMPHNPHTRKGRVRAKMAEAVMEAHHNDKVRAAIGRASNYIGPEYELLGDLVFYPALKGKTASLLGRLDVLHSFTYIPDFGKALATLGTREEALGQIWIAPSPPALTQRELMDLLGKEIGHPVKVRAAGKKALQLIGLFNPAIRETVEMLYEWENPLIVDSGKFERAFGINPTPLEKAVHETINWFRTRTMPYKSVA
jgi:nucleoside-diphosphate-sugar epimerase